MSKTIDNRVVQMDFDNAAFEKNVAQSMSTLDKLKEKLDFTDVSDSFSSITESAKSVNFNSMNSALDTVTVKFDVLRAAAAVALGGIIEDVAKASDSLMKSMSIDQVSQGWAKYNQRIAATQTIMAATHKPIEEIDESLEKLLWFTDETSYKFNDMVSSIGKFTSAGISLEDATNAMMGIANWAAVAGVGTEKASSAFLNMSQAMSKGYMQLTDWRSIQALNMNTIEFQKTCIDTAVAMGNLEKVGEDTYRAFGNEKWEFNTVGFANWLSKGWLSKDVLMGVLNTYGEYSDAIYAISGNYNTCNEAMEAFDKTAEASQISELAKRAFKAGQEAKSLSEAIDSVKEAVSSGWMETFQLIFGNYEEAKKLWTQLANELWDVFAAGGKARNKLLKDWANMTDSSETLITSFEQLGVTSKEQMSAVEKAVSNVAKRHGIDIDAMIAEHGSFEESLKSGWLSIDIFTEALGESNEGLSEGNALLEKYKEIAEDIWLNGSWGNGVDRYNALTEAGYDYAAVQEMVDKIAAGEEITIEGLSDAELKNLGYTEDEINVLRDLAKQAEETGTPLNDLIATLSTEKKTGRDYFIDGLFNVFHSMVAVIDTVKAAFSDVFPAITADQLFNITKKFSELTEKMIPSEETLELLQRSFKGLFAILDIGKTILTTVFRILKPFTSGTKTVVASILTMTATLGDMIYDFSEALKSSEKLESFTIKMADAFDKLGEHLSNFWSDFAKLFTNGKTTFSDVYDFINDKLHGLINTLIEFIENTTGLDLSDVKELFDTLSESIGKVSDKIKDLAKQNGFTDGIKEGFKSLKESFTKEDADKINLVSGATDALGNSVSFLTSVLDTFKDIGKTAWEVIKSVFGGIAGFASNLVEDMTGEDLLHAIESGAFAAMLISFSETAKALKATIEVFKDTAGIGKSIKGVFDAMTGSIKQLTSAIKTEAMATMLETIAKSILMFAAALLILSFIPEDKIQNAKETIGALTLVVLGIMYAANDLIKKDAAGAIVALTALLAAVSFAILQMAVALSVLALVSKVGDMSAAQEALAVTMGIVGGMLAVVEGIAGYFSTMPDTSSMAATLAAMSLLMVSICGVLLSVALSLSMIALVAKIGDMNAAMDAMFGILLGIGIAVGIMEALSKTADPGVLLSIAGIIFTVSKLVTSIATSLMMLALVSNSDGSNIRDAAIALGVLTGALALILGITSAKTNSADLASTAGSFVIMGAALVIFAGALTVLSKVNTKKLWDVMGVLGAIAAAFVIISMISASTEGVLSVALLSIGKAFTLLGTAILEIAAAFWIFIDALNRIPSAEKVTESLNNLVFGMLNSLKAMDDNLTKIIGYIGSILIKGFIGLIPDIIAGAMQIVIALCEAIDDWAYPIVDAFISLIETINTIIELEGDRFLEAASDLIINLLDLFIGAVYTVVRKLAAILSGQDPDDILPDWSTAKQDVSEFLKEFGGILTGPLTKMLCDGFAQVFIDMKEKWDSACEWMSEMGEKVGGFFEAIWNALYETGEGIGESLYETFVEPFEDMINDIFDLFGIEGDVSDVFFGLGDDLLNSLVNGIQKFIDDPIETLKELGRNMLDALITIPQDMLNTGKNIGEKLKDGVNWYYDTVKELPKKMLNAAKKLLDDTFMGKWFEKGEEVIQGLIDGMLSKQNALSAATGGIGASILKIFAKKLDINSPSKEFMKFGEYIDEGLIVGIEHYSKGVNKTVGKLGEGAIDTMGDAISDCASILDGSMNTSPVITPVMNIEGIQNGINRIDDMFSSSAALQYGLAVGAMLDGSSSMIVNTNNGDVVNEINRLRGDISTLSTAIQRMQIVMDSGALVGAISSDMDNALGQQLAYAGRGI